ncbi:MAG: RagB/SusD family nutrient uptake outer membrane protein, partial [Bacteroidota bacterium]
AVIGLYQRLGGDNYYRIRMPVYADIPGNAVPATEPDGTDPRGSLEEPYETIYALASGPNYNFGNMDAVYVAAYEVLYQANDAIALLPDVPDGTAEQRSSLLGEALAIRALIHFDLVRLFAQAPGFTADGSHAGVALIERVPGVFDLPARASVAEVYTSIRRDLEEAEQLIDASFSQRSSKQIWLTPTVVRGLLARVTAYLKDWEACRDWADRCLAGTDRELTANANYVAEWTDNRPTESLWLLDMQRHADEEEDSDSRITTPSLIIGADNDFPFLQVRPDLLDRHPAGDVRRGLYVANERGDMVTRKWRFAEGEVRNPVLLRLAEIYLLRAEALAELGRDAEAREDYRQIRQRALPNATIPELSGAELLAAIREERRLELAFEGHHFFDLSRWGADLEREACPGSVIQCSLTYPDPLYVLPIPLDALLRNPNLTQNPGY